MTPQHGELNPAAFTSSDTSIQDAPRVDLPTNPARKPQAKLSGFRGREPLAGDAPLRADASPVYVAYCSRTCGFLKLNFLPTTLGTINTRRQAFPST